MSEAESSSSNEPASESTRYKLIVAIGVMGREDRITDFTNEWVEACGRIAEELANVYAVQVLPLEEVDGEVR